MSLSLRVVGIGALLFAALLGVTYGASLLAPLLLVAAAFGWATLSIARWRPERVALVLAVLVVAGGGIAAGVRVADGIANDRVTYAGTLDMEEIDQSFGRPDLAAAGEPQLEPSSAGYARMTSGDGVMTRPDAEGAALTLWAWQELAPWAIAAIVLLLLAPLLRAAERGDPFAEDAPRRLALIGSLLVVAIPAISLLRYVAAQVASGGASFSPMISPSFTLSPIHFLPGLLVLVLAGIFRRGGELREFERQTI